MARKVAASMPQNMDLAFGYTIRWAALDPTTGTDVAGVLIEGAALLVRQVTPGSSGDLATATFAPLLTPVTLDEQADPGAGDG